jgi:hypothetical protein
MNIYQPTCAGCGQAIRGAYIQALGATWHTEHFVCNGCHRPVGRERFMVYENSAYHDACYKQFVAPRCAFCNKALIGEYLTDHWGTKFCAEHRHQYPDCVCCGRLIPPHQQERNAEMRRCQICRATAVETIDDARPFYAQVVRWAGSQGLVYNNYPISLELCDRSRLSRLLHERGGDHSLGVTTSVSHFIDGRITRIEVKGIAVLRGLPAPLFQGVTMHELGHVWLILHGIQGLPSWGEEGFCELLAHRYLQALATAEGRYFASCIEKNPGPDYGDGFRRLYALSQKHGFSQLLRLLEKTKRLP